MQGELIGVGEECGNLGVDIKLIGEETEGQKTP